ncbi:MAG: hypothetical protein WA655_18015 [Candidatus Korobacteraceae bacterium]
MDSLVLRELIDGLPEHIPEIVSEVNQLSSLPFPANPFHNGRDMIIAGPHISLGELRARLADCERRMQDVDESTATMLKEEAEMYKKWIAARQREM